MIDKNKEIIIIIVAIIVTFITSALMFNRYHFDHTDYIAEEVNNAKSDAYQYEKESKEYYNKGDDYKKQNETLKEDIQSLSETDRNCYLKFMKHSIFLDDYADYNNQFYLSNVEFYHSLVVYEDRLDKYSKSIQSDLHRIILSPMLVSDFKKLGFELNLLVPVTSNFLITGGVGYLNNLYFKIGLGLRL